MARIILRAMFILSISLNIAWVAFMFSHPSEKGEIQLNLTDQQKKKVNKIHMEIHRENESVKAKIIEHQKDLLYALKEKEIDREKVGKCLDQISSLQKKIQQNTVKEIIQIKKYLDSDQCDCLLKGLGKKLSQVSKPCDKECCRPKK